MTNEVMVLLRIVAARIKRNLAALERPPERGEGDERRVYDAEGKPGHGQSRDEM